MLLALDDAAVRRWAESAVTALGSARRQLDALNVFPVPDGDTGTNLLLTAESAIAALRDGLGDEPAWTVLARGAVLGARGNSGAILAQLLRGLADSLAGQPRVEGATWAAAMRAAADTAYAAVADPAEGTLLTVARRGADAAGQALADGHTTLADVVRATAAGAREALHATTGQLEALRSAGVVDAGGAGWCVLLDALVATVTESAAGLTPLVPRPERPVDRHRHAHDEPHQPPPGPGSEVQFLLADSTPEAVTTLRRRLAELGDSLVVVGVDTPGGREWNVHVHVDDVGAALEAGVEAGRPHRITVTPLAPQHVPDAVPGRRAVVTLLPPGGLAALFAGEGTTVLTTTDGTATEDDVLSAVLASGAAEVVVLPNGEETGRVASRVARRARTEGRSVAVVPTRSPVQGLAALAVTDPTQDFSDDVITMTEAAAATRWAELTVADQEALTSAGRCRPGDLLGSAEGDVLVIGTEQEVVACDLLDRLLSAGGELATLVVGEDRRLGDAVCAHLAAVHPTVEATLYAGAPDGVLLLLGVE